MTDIRGKKALGDQEVDLFNTRKMQISPRDLFLKRPLPLARSPVRPAALLFFLNYYSLFRVDDAAARAQFILWCIRDRDLVS